MKENLPYGQFVLTIVAAALLVTCARLEPGAHATPPTTFVAVFAAGCGAAVTAMQWPREGETAASLGALFLLSSLPAGVVGALVLFVT